MCCLFLLTNCGSISLSSIDELIEDIAEDHASHDSQVLVFATDYASGGQIYSATITNHTAELANADLTELGSDAVIKYENGLLYILHSGWSLISSDNLEIVDPDDNFAVEGQYSVGNGTNPHDVVVNGNKAYISLYNPTADSENIDEDGNPADVIVMDVNNGSILERYSFYNYLNDDGDRNGHAHKLMLVGNVLYVCLQDLSGDGWFMANSGGKLGMIDIVNQEITGAITLQGWNPASLTPNDDHTKMFVASVDDYSTMSGHGGIEVVDLASQTSETFLLDSTLGAYVDNIKSTRGSVYAVASTIDWITFTSSSQIISFPQTISTIDDISDFTVSGADIRDIAVDDDFLWVTTRIISTTEGDTSPVIRVYNTASGEQLGEDLVPTVAGVSIAIVE